MGKRRKAFEARFGPPGTASQEPCVVAVEFDPAFRSLGETRVHVGERVGEGTQWISS